MSKRKPRPLNEVVNINGSKVFAENGEVKTILSEEIQRTGYMSVEDAKELTIAAVTKIYQLGGALPANPWDD